MMVTKFKIIGRENNRLQFEQLPGYNGFPKNYESQLVGFAVQAMPSLGKDAIYGIIHDKEYGEFIPVCLMTGAELDAEQSLEDAIAAVETR